MPISPMAVVQNQRDSPQWDISAPPDTVQHIWNNPHLSHCLFALSLPFTAWCLTSHPIRLDLLLAVTGGRRHPHHTPRGDMGNHGRNTTKVWRTIIPNLLILKNLVKGLILLSYFPRRQNCLRSSSDNLFRFVVLYNPVDCTKEGGN